MTGEGYKYILTCHHNLSKHLVAIPMFTQTAEEVALNVMRHVGIPSSIVTDQGTQFMGDIFKGLCKLLKYVSLTVARTILKGTARWRGRTKQ